MDTIEKAAQRLLEIGAEAAKKAEGLPVQKPAPAAKVVPSVSKAAEILQNQTLASSAGNSEHPPQADNASNLYAFPEQGGNRRRIDLDLEKIRDAGMVVPDDKRSRVKEEYRHIKRPLLMNADGKGDVVAEHRNLIMVTSCRPGEGKTFTSINLAMSIAAEPDRTVLLIDADVVKPSISKFFGLKPGPGLVDYLVDKDLQLNDLLVDTSVPTMKFLPAGTSHHLSTELLASENMERLANDLSRRYPNRIVIFDSPPLLATTEASVLARLAGQVLFVVEAESTKQANVADALALLDQDKSVGFVLNKARSSSRTGYYGGYSYYGEQ